MPEEVQNRTFGDDRNRLVQKNDVRTSDMLSFKIMKDIDLENYLVSDDAIECVIKRCSNFGTELISIITESDSEEYVLYCVCNKHYDELIRRYYDKPNLPFPLQS